MKLNVRSCGSSVYQSIWLSFHYFLSVIVLLYIFFLHLWPQTISLHLNSYVCTEIWHRDSPFFVCDKGPFICQNITVNVKWLTFISHFSLINCLKRLKLLQPLNCSTVLTDFTLKNVPPQGYIADSFSPYCATPSPLPPPPSSPPPPPALLSFPCPLDLAD